MKCDTRTVHGKTISKLIINGGVTDFKTWAAKFFDNLQLETRNCPDFNVFRRNTFNYLLEKSKFRLAIIYRDTIFLIIAMLVFMCL
jgi:hypothetical protein